MNLIGIENNHVIGVPIEAGENKVQFKGVGNKLIFGKNTQIENVRIAFEGSDSIIEFYGFNRLRGAFIVGDKCKISVGRNTIFNKPCRLHAAEYTNIDIGAECYFEDVRFRTSDSHSIIDISIDQRVNFARGIIVGDRVWIDEGVCVYKGGDIGEGSVVDVGSVVVRSVPANCLAAGTPAKVMKTNVTWKTKVE